MTASQGATIVFCLALCLGLFALATRLSRVAHSRPPSKPRSTRPAPERCAELAGDDRVLAAQERSLRTWLLATAERVRTAPVSVHEVTPDRLGQRPRRLRPRRAPSRERPSQIE